MKTAVWDTYVARKDGLVMHFDIIVPEATSEQTVFNYGKAYLASKGLEGHDLNTRECQFCHIETVKPDWEASIVKDGYYIFEMENCH